MTALMSLLPAAGQEESVDPSELPLFRVWPRLRSGLDRRPFLVLPTPVEALPLPGFSEAGLFVKRDERSCPLYGGNKPRKLELVIGAARARGRRRLLTTGALGTNHGLATTILAGADGLATTLVLVDQPMSDEVRHKLLLAAAWGAELIYGGSVAGAGLQLARVLARSVLSGERVALVPAGGSSTLGCLGFVSAGLELAEQAKAGELPVPDEIWLPVGTGGTLAGLVLGLKLAGLPTRVKGVLVTDILPPTPARLARRARAALELLRRIEPAIPSVALGPDDFALVTTDLGGGYGAATPQADEAVALAAERGVQLETTYTGKCLAALIDHARSLRTPRGPVLFWNTYNAVDVAAVAPRPLSADALPEPLRRLVLGCGHAA